MAKKVLFIGWDAADWKAIHPLIDAGRMPNLQRLIERGAMGRVATLNPPLSPMLWTSIATGKRPFKHGIHGFTEPTPDGRGVRAVTNLSRTTKAVWNILNQNGLRSNVIGWWPSHPAEPIDGVMVSDQYHRARHPLDEGWPMSPFTVHPPELRETLAELRLHPQELLGPMLVPFLPALEKVDRERDQRFAGLCRTLSECVTIHSAAAWVMDNRPWDFFAVYYDAIDHFCHGFMRYHPPRQPWISEADFELYSSVVSTAYVLHDRMLGTLLRKAGDDTTTILMSDHGFHPDHLRANSIPHFPAGPAVEHSPYGIFTIAGPGIKKDVSLFGLSVLDLTPTVLELFGLPAGDDMDGRVIVEAFEEPPEPRTIPSWDDVPGSDGRHPPQTRLDPVAATEALEQLIALGYVEKPGEDLAEYVAQTVRELRFNLIESLQDAARHGEALELARDLCRSDPNEPRYALARFLSCQALGLTAEMREIADDMDGRLRRVFEEAIERMKSWRDLANRRFEERKAAAGQTFTPEERDREVTYELSPALDPPEPREFLLNRDERKEMSTHLRLCRYNPALTDLIRSQTLVAEKRWFEALESLKRVSGAPTIRPGILLANADLLRRLGRLDESAVAYRKALTVDPDNVHAYLGLSRLALRRHAYADAESLARECIGRLYFYPLAHLLRSIALTGLAEYETARDSLLIALSQNPHFPLAHLWLARLLKHRLNDPGGAEEHLLAWREMRSRAPESRSEVPAERLGSVVVPPVAAATPGDIALPPLGEEILVVSGLPRSGTSMLMQMLDAGGCPLLTDHAREADEDNPKGYFEFEKTKSLFRDNDWVAQARGRAIKVVAPLVSSLPGGYAYRVILIERDYDEILASQARMITRRGESIVDSLERRERLRDEYARVIQRTKKVLAERGDLRLLELRYDGILRDPVGSAALISAFAGGGLHTSRMIAAVDHSLHRNVVKEA